jgi:hypothetical protein
VIAARGVDVESTEQWLEETNPRPSAPLVFEPSDKTFSIRLPLRPEDGQLVGWILVGARPDRSCLSTAERDALIEIVDPTARAIRLVLKREARETETKATLAGLQKQIDSLAERLRIDRAGTAA